MSLLKYRCTNIYLLTNTWIYVHVNKYALHCRRSSVECKLLLLYLFVLTNGRGNLNIRTNAFLRIYSQFSSVRRQNQIGKGEFLLKFKSYLWSSLFKALITAMDSLNSIFHSFLSIFLYSFSPCKEVNSNVTGKLALQILHMTWQAYKPDLDFYFTLSAD